MGALQMAGLVSGFGKGVQRGLEQTQNYMINSELLRERDEYDRKRMEITYGRELGAINLKAGLDRETMREREGLQQLNTKELRGIDQADALKRLEVGHGYDVQKDQQRQQDKIAEELRQQGYKKEEVEHLAKLEMQKLKLQEEIDVRKGKRKAKEDEGAFQREAGKDIVLESMRQKGRSHTEDSKLRPDVDADLKIYKQELDSLADEMNNVMTKPERVQAIRREMAGIRDKMRQLIGHQSAPSTRDRPQYTFPQ